jgi:hypothetical protein
MRGESSRKSKEVDMPWIWIFSGSHRLFRVVRMQLYHHHIRAFHALLVSGDLLVLVALWYTRQVLVDPHQYALWLAGGAATCGMLSIFTIMSAWINGYWHHRDPWLAYTTGLMFVFSIVSIMSAFQL